MSQIGELDLYGLPSQTVYVLLSTRNIAMGPPSDEDFKGTVVGVWENRENLEDLLKKQIVEPHIHGSNRTVEEWYEDYEDPVEFIISLYGYMIVETNLY